MNANDLDNIRDILTCWKLDIYGKDNLLSEVTIRQMANHYGLDKEEGTHLFNPIFKRTDKCEEERKRR